MRSLELGVAARKRFDDGFFRALLVERRFDIAAQRRERGLRAERRLQFHELFKRGERVAAGK